MKNITVLLGGSGCEREVSLNSGNATVAALKELGEFHVSTIDLPDDLNSLVTQVKDQKPDVVFNCLHGPIGEDGTVQKIFNDLKVPYTHSGAKASELAMNKWESYQLFEKNAIPTPKTYKVIVNNVAQPPINYPFMIKPINEGSSVGIEVISSDEEWKNVISNWKFGHECIIQEFLKHREIHVAVLNDEALGTIEVRPKENFSFFSYEAKYVKGESEFLCPAPINPEQTELAKSTALKSYQAIGCRGLARIDMMFDGNIFRVLELNTQPGFTATSLAPQIAKSQGISFADLVKKMTESARCD